jgi:hypothetical protein
MESPQYRHSKRLLPAGCVILSKRRENGETFGRLYNNAHHGFIKCKLLCFGAKIGFRLNRLTNILRYICTVLSHVALTP